MVTVIATFTVMAIVTAMITVMVIGSYVYN